VLHFTSTQILAWLGAWFYPLCRIAALVGTAPVLSDSGAPQRVKIALAIAITAVVGPTVDSVPAADLASWEGLAVVARQIVIGAAMGMTMRVTFAAFTYAGDMIGLQMGLGFATLFDPQHNQQTPVVGSLLSYLAALIFLALNGHLILIGAVAESFRSLPVASASGMTLDWRALVDQGALTFVLALHIALPVIAALLLANAILGVMMRSAPQLNLFAIGFPATLLIGAAALYFALPDMLGAIQRGLVDAMGRIIPW
jgi:flagellar biosynthetic protein FliR